MMMESTNNNNTNNEDQQQQQNGIGLDDWINDNNNNNIIDDPLQQLEEQTEERTSMNRNNTNTTFDTSELQQQNTSLLSLSDGTNTVLSSKDDIIQLLNERYVLNLTKEQDELLDPIERTIRYIIPIPKYYYWDILTVQQQQQQKEQSSSSSSSIIITTKDIPYSIKLWHTTIYQCDQIGTFLNNYIAQPIASYTGLTGPRFHEVISTMTPNDIQQSQMIINERMKNSK